MGSINQNCKICKGRGWYETYRYELENDPQPCPDCNPCTPPTRGEIAFIGFCFVVFFVLMLLGAWS